LKERIEEENYEEPVLFTFGNGEQIDIDLQSGDIDDFFDYQTNLRAMDGAGSLFVELEEKEAYNMSILIVGVVAGAFCLLAIVCLVL
jgi:hypothetical protein